MTTKPRPNVRITWRTCSGCSVDYIASSDGLCPRCVALGSDPVSEPWVWTIYVLLLTVVALGLTAIWVVLR